jgi:diguanylate cyclase (GGDEF)-like protein
LEVTLRRLGHEVSAVSDGAQALDKLSGDDAPRLAILDWVMPGLDGLEVCRQLRKRTDRYQYLILLTARSEREDMVTALEADIDDVLTKPFDAAELKARLRSGVRVLELQEGLLRKQEELRHLATRDHLTGILNRRTIVECAEVELKRGLRGLHELSPLSIMIADLDRFKNINDTYGHATGDAVLVAAAECMRSVLRAHDVIGRYGGEEFLVVLPGCDVEAAAAVGKRLLTAVSDLRIPVADILLGVTISVGVATTRSGRESAAELIAAADRALYQAKAAGRNRLTQCA